MVRYMSDQYFKVIKIEPTILMLVVGVIHHRTVMTNKFNFYIERKQNRRPPPTRDRSFTEEKQLRLSSKSKWVIVGPFWMGWASIKSPTVFHLILKLLYDVLRICWYIYTDLKIYMMISTLLMFCNKPKTSHISWTRRLMFDLKELKVDPLK